MGGSRISAPAGKTAAERVAEASGPLGPAPKLNVSHVAAAWQGAWLVLQGLVWVIAGRHYRLEILTPAEAMADAQILWPLVERHPILARILSWIGAPVALVRRVAGKIKRKGSSDGDAGSAGGAVPGR